MSKGFRDLIVTTQDPGIAYVDINHGRRELAEVVSEALNNQAQTIAVEAETIAGKSGVPDISDGNLKSGDSASDMSSNEEGREGDSVGSRIPPSKTTLEVEIFGEGKEKDRGLKSDYPRASNEADVLGNMQQGNVGQNLAQAHSPVPSPPTTHKKFNYREWTEKKNSEGGGIICEANKVDNAAEVERGAEAAMQACKSSIYDSSSQFEDLSSDEEEPERVQGGVYGTHTINDLTLSPYISREEAQQRLDVLGLEAAQREINSFAALCITGNAFRQAQESQMKTKDNSRKPGDNN